MQSAEWKEFSTLHFFSTLYFIPLPLFSRGLKNCESSVRGATRLPRPQSRAVFQTTAKQLWRKVLFTSFKNPFILRSLHSERVFVYTLDHARSSRTPSCFRSAALPDWMRQFFKRQAADLRAGSTRGDRSVVGCSVAPPGGDAGAAVRRGAAPGNRLPTNGRPAPVDRRWNWMRWADADGPDLQCCAGQ